MMEPIAEPKVSAEMATMNEARAPTMMRLRMSRPRLSVPSRNRASPPSSHEGGRKRRRRFWS